MTSEPLGAERSPGGSSSRATTVPRWSPAAAAGGSRWHSRLMARSRLHLGEARDDGRPRTSALGRAVDANRRRGRICPSARTAEGVPHEARKSCPGGVLPWRASLLVGQQARVAVGLPGPEPPRRRARRPYSRPRRQKVQQWPWSATVRLRCNAQAMRPRRHLPGPEGMAAAHPRPRRRRGEARRGEGLAPAEAPALARPWQVAAMTLGEAGDGTAQAASKVGRSHRPRPGVPTSSLSPTGRASSRASLAGPASPPLPGRRAPLLGQ